MKFVVEIELGNDAMRTGRHLGEALADLAGHIRHDIGAREPSFRDEGSIRDENGNKVGSWRFEPE